MNQRITEFSTFGSDTSKNIFNKEFSKNLFKINQTIEAVTLISLMSKPIQYDNKLINSNQKYNNTCVINDLSKSFLNFLKKNVWIT